MRSADLRDRVVTYRGELPEGWAAAALPELVAYDGEFSDGDWVESKDQDPDGAVRLIQLADVGDGEYRDRSERFLTLDKARELGCTFLQVGDILLARMPDPLGRACIFPGDDKPSVTVVDVCIVRPGANSVESRWLMYTINAPSVRAAIASLQSGTTRQRISRGNLATLELPIPPIAEQRRIVEAIEQQFTRLDAGVAALKRAQAALKRYRAAVLKSAVEGKLTEAWRAAHPDVEPASTLLERILAERRARWEADLRAKGKDPAKAKYDEPQAPDTAELPQLPEGWCWASLSMLASRIGDVDHKMPQAQASGIPYISTKDFVGEDGIDFEGAKRVSQEDFYALARKIRPQQGDILVSRYGTVGEVRLVHASIDFQASYSVAIIKTLRESYSVEYLALALRTDIVQAQMRRDIRASSQPDLGLEYIRQFAIPLPPLPEQVQIVEEIERRLSVVSELEAAVAANLKRVERLRQSILERAFAGRLVPQDPNDEPASALLERIRGKREYEAQREMSKVIALSADETCSARLLPTRLFVRSQLGLWGDAVDKLSDL